MAGPAGLPGCGRRAVPLWRCGAAASIIPAQRSCVRSPQLRPVRHYLRPWLQRLARVRRGGPGAVPSPSGSATVSSATGRRRPGGPSMTWAASTGVFTAERHKRPGLPGGRRPWWMWRAGRVPLTAPLTYPGLPPWRAAVLVTGTAVLDVLPLRAVPPGEWPVRRGGRARRTGLAAQTSRLTASSATRGHRPSASGRQSSRLVRTRHRPRSDAR